MSYEVKISDRAVKSLKRVDRSQAVMIISWIEKNLAGCENPRAHGKALAGDLSGYWRYRVGTYRIIAEIDDRHVRIEIINVAHRRDVYQ